MAATYNGVYPTCSSEVSNSECRCDSTYIALPVDIGPVSYQESAKNQKKIEDDKEDLPDHLNLTMNSSPM